METPDQTVTVSNRANEVVVVYKILMANNKNEENVKHLWSLAYSIVADTHRGNDNK